MNDNSSKYILITGATGGIGRSIAEYLAGQHYNVIATGRNQTALDELKVLAAKNNWMLHAWKLDVTSQSDIHSISKKALKITSGKGIDILINNAGYGQAGFISDLNIEQVRKQFEVNLFGLLEVTRSFIPQLIQQRGRKIINIGSIMSRMVAPWTGIYCVSKHAVKAANDVLRMELHPFGVKVIHVEPGSINTSFQEDTINSLENVNITNSLYSEIHEWMKTSAYKAFYAMPGVDAFTVAKKVHHIIRKKKVRRYYVVPFRARLLLWVYSLVPGRLIENGMRRNFNLNRKLTVPRLELENQDS